jgi:hypothetical protein
VDRILGGHSISGRMKNGRWSIAVGHSRAKRRTMSFDCSNIRQ